jgi:hypothetical protein
MKRQDAFDPATGVNCQLLIHLVYQDWFGVNLPQGMWSKEIFEDTGRVFRSVVAEEEPLVQGDVFVFQGQKANPKSYHLAVHTGQRDATSDPLLLHASREEDVVTVWPLTTFLKDGLYRQLAAVKRLDAALYDVFVAPVRTHL